AGAALLVLVAIEFARDRNRVEREPVGGRDNLRVDDVAAGDSASARDVRQEPRVILCEYGELGDAARGVDPRDGRELLTGFFRFGDEARIRNLAYEIDLQPVRRIMAGGVGI